MSAVEMRTHVHQIIDEVDESFLKIVCSMLDAYQQEQKDPIVGYETDGTSIKLSTLEEQADEALAQVERGEYITFEELEKESELWLRHSK